MTLVILAAALALVIAVVTWAGQRSAAEAEATIRLAIEKGVLTDPALIPKLREPAGLSWVERLILLGMLVLFAAGGLLAVGLVLTLIAVNPPTPLFALAAFAACLGGGLLYCGRWLRRSRGLA